MTPNGEMFVRIGILERTQIFAQLLDGRIELINHSCRVLATREDHRAAQERFARVLEDYMSSDDAEGILATTIDWGRCAELFGYDANVAVLNLEPVEGEDS